jgi:hypothetical protein
VIVRLVQGDEDAIHRQVIYRFNERGLVSLDPDQAMASS